MKRRIYFENLDGMRFICFLLVFGTHTFYTDNRDIYTNATYRFFDSFLFANGNLGVNCFFVLSGFLITYLLIQEKKINGQINIPKFWIRRILRIWPLYFFCVLFGFFLFPIFKSFFGQTGNETASLSYYLTFLSNFDFLNKGRPDSSVLSVLWSVAIEEQFYFFWPIILYFLPVRRYCVFFISIALCSVFFRAYYDNHLFNEIHTLSCMGDMAIGAIGAWFISEKHGFKKSIVNLRRYHIISVYLLLLVIILFRRELFSDYAIGRIFDRLLIAVLFLVVMLEQSFSERSFIKLSQLRVSQLGIYTYGLYCLHTIVLLTVTTLTNLAGWDTQVWQVLFFEPVMALFFSILVARFSYRYFESPFLKLKEKFSYISRVQNNSIESPSIKNAILPSGAVLN